MLQKFEDILNLKFIFRPVNINNRYIGTNENKLMNFFM